MATDLNKQLNLDKFIENLDILIQKTEALNSNLSDIGKTAEETAKQTDALNKSQEQSEDIVKDTVKATSELEKIQKQNITTSEKLEQVYSAENEELQRQKIELQNANKELKDRIKAENAAEKASANNVKTIKEAQDANKQLRIAVKNLDTTTAEGQKQIAEYNKIIEQNDALIRENSDSYIQQKINIGNYQGSVNSLIPILENNSAIFKGLGANVEAATEKIIQANIEAGKGDKALTSYEQATAALKGGFQTVNASLKAFLANPVVLIVAGITAAFFALKEALNATEEGQELLAVASGFLEGVLTGIKEIVVALAKPLIALFNDPVKAVEDFEQAIKDKVIATFDALKNIALGVGDILTGIWERDLDKITQGAKDAGNAFIDLNKEINPAVILLDQAVQKGAEIIENAKEQSRIEKERFQLEQARNKLLIEEAELSRDIAKSREQSRNETIDTREQLEEISKAEALINELAALKIADKREELKLLQEEQELSSNNLEDNKEAAQLLADIIKLEEQQANQLRSIGRDRRAIVKSLEEEREAELLLFETQQEKNEAAKNFEIDISTLKVGINQKEREDLAQAEAAKQELAEETLKANLGFANTFATSSASIAADTFGNEKDAAIAKSLINTYEGITKALATSGPFGIAQAVLIGAAGAVQTAKIAGVNAFYKGTQSAPAGPAFISERGAELIEDNKGNLKLVPDMSLINLQGGEKIHTAQETRKMMFDDSRIIKELRRSKTKVIVNINKDSYASKYRMKA